VKSLFANLFLLLCAVPASAQDKVEVDLELVLLVDVSRSMTPKELEIQRRGYAEALASDEVFKAVQGGLLQSIALTYVEWAGTQDVLVDWRLVKTREDLQQFASELTATFGEGLRRTSISGAIEYGAFLIERNDYEGLRRVLDVSGDGPNNMGPFVDRARDEALAQGIVINGLPLMTEDSIGTQPFWHLENLDFYYETCVIGGPGSFVIPVLTWPDFADAVRRKLVLEIADLGGDHMDAPRIIKAQLSSRDPSDCQIGEKIWNEWVRERQFQLP